MPIIRKERLYIKRIFGCVWWFEIGWYRGIDKQSKGDITLIVDQETIQFRQLTLTGRMAWLQEVNVTWKPVKTQLRHQLGITRHFEVLLARHVTIMLQRTSLTVEKWNICVSES